MARQPDYYRILGISRNASADQIRSAYRRAARKWHPDRNRSAEASEMMRLVNRARDVLLDDKARRDYDRDIGGTAANDFTGPGKSTRSTGSRDWETAADEAWARHKASSASREKTASGKRPGDFLYDRDPAENRGPSILSQALKQLAVYRYVAVAAFVVIAGASWLSAGGLPLSGISVLPDLEPTVVPRISTPVPSPASGAGSAPTATPISAQPTATSQTVSNPEATAVATAIASPTSSPSDPTALPGTDHQIALIGIEPVRSCFIPGERVSFKYRLENASGETLEFDVGGAIDTLFPDFLSWRSWIQRTGHDDSIVAIYSQRPFTEQLADGRYEADEAVIDVGSFLDSSTWRAGVEYERPVHLGIATTDFPLGGYRFVLELMDTARSAVIDSSATTFQVGGC